MQLYVNYDWIKHKVQLKQVHYLCDFTLSIVQLLAAKQHKYENRIGFEFSIENWKFLWISS